MKKFFNCFRAWFSSYKAYDFLAMLFFALSAFCYFLYCVDEVRFDWIACFYCLGVSFLYTILSHKERNSPSPEGENK